MKKHIISLALINLGFVATLLPCEIVMINDRDEDHKIIHRDKQDVPHELVVKAGETVKFGDPHLRANITIFDLDPQGECEKVLKVKQISCGGNSNPKEIHISKAFGGTLDAKLFKIDDYRCDDISPSTGAPIARYVKGESSAVSHEVETSPAKTETGGPSCGCGGE